MRRLRQLCAMNGHGPLFDHFVSAGEHTVGPIALRSGWERTGRRLSPFSFFPGQPPVVRLLCGRNGGFISDSDMT
jgi:hypothetical protein